MKVVILESPYSGNIQRNIAYAQRCMADSRENHGEIPIVPHLLWTQHHLHPTHFVSDYSEKYTLKNCGRDVSIKQIEIFRQKADKIVFYVDYGFSKGMEYGLFHCKRNKIPYEKRKIGNIEEDTINSNRRI